MDIYAKSGERVKFKECRDGHLIYSISDNANKYLIKDKIYTVLYTKVFSSSSYVILKEFPELKFNTCCFY